MVCSVPPSRRIELDWADDAKKTVRGQFSEGGSAMTAFQDVTVDTATGVALDDDNTQALIRFLGLDSRVVASETIYTVTLTPSSTAVVVTFSDAVGKRLGAASIFDWVPEKCAEKCK